MSRNLESPERIEPTRIEESTELLSDLVAELSTAAALLGHKLHPSTAANLAHLVRVTNTYYSNLIEGHNTRPMDVERALIGQFESNEDQRNLQIEAAAHVRVQSEIDDRFKKGLLPDPYSSAFILWLYREFYRDAPDSMLRIQNEKQNFQMVPGQWRSHSGEDGQVGRHTPPSSHRVQEFMDYFTSRFQSPFLTGKTAKITAMAISHHRFNYIDPFPDGNGRVSRLMSHAVAHTAGVGAEGLWSISRGLARGLKGGIEGRQEYKRMMDHADQPRKGDLDGRGNISRQALIDFVEWFLRVSLDQVHFMSEIFEFNALFSRLRIFVEQHQTLGPEVIPLLEQVLIRGEVERGEIPRILRLPERTARRVLNQVVASGLLASNTVKGPVSIRFPAETLESLFPRLFS